MELIQPNGGPQPVQAEPTSRKRKRLPLVICQVLMVIMVTKQASSLVDAATAMIQTKRTWMLLNAHLPSLIEFMLRNTHFLAELGQKRRRADSSVAGTPNISLLMIREMPQLKPQVQAQPPTKMLKFVGPLKEPFFYTNRKLTHFYDHPLEVQLIDTKTNKICSDAPPLKVEIVVISGDFLPAGQYEFEKSILNARGQRRPLIVGKKLVEKLKDGKAVFEDVMITDTSKNFQCQTFRLGARVVQSPNFPWIQEAWTDDFRVKDCRGEKDKKHEWPTLDDKMWRLKNIAKDGTFHGRLLSFKNSQGDPVPIETVGDFLDMLITDPAHLKSTLKMKDNKWQETVEHARKAIPAPEETIMVNFVGNDTEPNPAQVIENMCVLQPLDPHTSWPFDQTMSFPTNTSTFNQGPATNRFVLGETSNMFNCLTNYFAGPNIHPTNWQINQMDNNFLTNLTFNRGESSMVNSGGMVDLRRPIEGGNYAPQVDQMEGPSSNSISNGGNNAQLLPTNLGVDQISVGLLTTAPVFNGDEATPQEGEAPIYAQPNMNQYEELPADWEDYPCYLDG